MDHLWQFAGTAEESMLEAYTTLGYLAAATERVLLHTLVTAVTYRRPGLLAKTMSTLDALSGDRAGLGVASTSRKPPGLAWTSRRPPSGSNGWRRPCRSACRCGAAGKTPSPAATTSSPAPLPAGWLVDVPQA